MSLTIELSPELEQQIFLEAARAGRPPAEFVRALLEECLAARRTHQIERSQGAVALLRRWRDDSVDPEGEEGYPKQIERLGLR